MSQTALGDLSKAEIRVGEWKWKEFERPEPGCVLVWCYNLDTEDLPGMLSLYATMCLPVP